MSRPARSLFVFAFYILLAGVSFLVVPGVLISVLGLPPATPGWPRMIGLLALVIGTYDLVAARAESMPYIRATIVARCGFAAGTVLLVGAAQMPATVLLFGAMDLAGAAWTAWELRAAGTPIVAPA